MTDAERKREEQLDRQTFTERMVCYSNIRREKQQQQKTF